jgi:type I restriction enzyme S subunit
MANDDLPLGWARTDLSRIIEEAQPGFACGRRDENGYIQLRMNNIGLSGNLVLNSMLKVPRNLTNLAKYGLRKNDVIFNNTNSAELVGKTVLFRGELHDSVYSNHLTRLRVRPGIAYPEWLTWLLVYEQQLGTFERMCRRFVGQASVNRIDLLRLPVRLPPYGEQIRIATKIEDLFHEIATVKETVQRVPSMMKQFRQSVLSRVFGAELTEPTSMLAPSERQWQHTRNEVGSTLALSSPNSHAGWTTVRVKDIAEVRLGKQRSPKNRPGKFARKYGRVANVFRDRFDLSDVKEMDFPYGDFERYRLLKGDVLLCEGQSPELVGRCAVWNDEIPDCCFQNTLIRVRSNEVAPRYLLHVFEHAADRGDFAELATQGVNIAHLGATRLADYQIPLAPAKERAHIVEKIDQLFDFATDVENHASLAQQKTSLMEQSILWKAFNGELVPQVSNEEPASILLEGIERHSES